MLRKDMIGSVLAGCSVLVTASILCSAAPAADGKALFEKRCGGCHAVDRDKEGPRLGGVYGRTAGSLDSFQYSDALKKSKLKWAEETLDKWLSDPEKLVPNNDMTFHVEKADERSHIIAYLKSLTSR
jgi:cytochrome c